MIPFPTISGVVKWYSPEKKYGFITGEDGKEYFVHHSQFYKAPMNADLVPGDKVIFLATQSPKGLTAKDVKVIKEPKKFIKPEDKSFLDWAEEYVEAVEGISALIKTLKVSGKASIPITKATEVTLMTNCYNTLKKKAEQEMLRMMDEGNIPVDDFLAAGKILHPYMPGVFRQVEK